MRLNPIIYVKLLDWEKKDFKKILVFIILLLISSVVFYVLYPKYELIEADGKILKYNKITGKVYRRSSDRQYWFKY